MKFEIPKSRNPLPPPMSPRGFGGPAPVPCLLPSSPLLTAGCQPASRKEFLLKCKIALKECSETRFWLDLLARASIFPASRLAPLRATCTDLLRMLAATCKTTQERLSAQ